MGNANCATIDTHYLNFLAYDGSDTWHASNCEGCNERLEYGESTTLFVNV